MDERKRPQKRKSLLQARALARMQKQLTESVDMCLELDRLRQAKCEDVDRAIARELLAA
jgi:hypothetical protein